MRAVSVKVAAAVGLVLAGAGLSASAAESTSDRGFPGAGVAKVKRSVAVSADVGTCSPGSIPATIAGRRVCLRRGQRCARRHDSQLHRYGFHCHGARLAFDPYLRLRRPLHLPIVAPGAPCPVGASRRVDEAHGPALGDGPIYAVGHGPDATITLRNDSLRDGGWWYWKVIWIRVGDFVGHVLVRGRQLDGPNVLRFSGSNVAKPRADLRLLFRTETNEGAGPRYTRLRAPGCYGYQVDSASFSQVIVFRAALVG